MSKITKSDLKGIVKECLIEILAEGLLPGKTTISESKRKKRKLSQKLEKSTSHVRPSYLDSLSYGEIPQIKEEKRQPPKINTNISNDSVLNEIFADTAANTLQEQIAADSRKHGMMSVSSQGDQASKIVAKSNPVDLFGGEAASKWSKLAFSDAK
jgi:hypothetical protein